MERHMLRPFIWGHNDCATAVANVLIDMGKPDIAAPYRGLYRDEKEAAAVGRVEDRAAERFAHLGWPELDPGAAEDGAVGVRGNSLFIRSDGVWWGKSEDGCVSKPRVRRAWRPV